MKKLSLVLLFVSLMFTACVPYKSIIYVQGDLNDQNKVKTVYQVQENDILYVEIKSADKSTQALFNSGTQGNSNSLMNSQSLYFKGYTVQQGDIELPLLGEIKVVDLNFEQIKQSIKTKLLEKQFKTLDDIFVTVKLAGVPYSILGEINEPQTGVLYKENPNIIDAIAASGDISMVGDRKHIVVIRTINNKKTKNTIDLTQSDVINSPYYYVRPNDIIYIQPLRQKTLGTGTTLTQTISTTITALSLITTIILISNYAKN